MVGIGSHVYMYTGAKTVVETVYGNSGGFEVKVGMHQGSALSPLLLWPPYVIGQAIIFSCCAFYLLSIYLFFPRLISAVGDWMSTIVRHMVWP